MMRNETTQLIYVYPVALAVCLQLNTDAPSLPYPYIKNNRPQANLPKT